MQPLPITPDGFRTPVRLNLKQSILDLTTKSLDAYVQYKDGHWISLCNKNTFLVSKDDLLQALSNMQEPILYDPYFTGLPVRLECSVTNYTIELKTYPGKNNLPEDLMWVSDFRGYVKPKIQRGSYISFHDQSDTKLYNLVNIAYRLSTNQAFELSLSKDEKIWVSPKTHVLNFCNYASSFLEITELKNSTYRQIFFDSLEEMGQFAKQFLNLIQK